MCFEMIILYTKTKTDFCTVAFQRYKMSSNDDIHRVFLNKPSQLIAFLSKRVQLQTQRFVINFLQSVLLSLFYRNMYFYCNYRGETVTGELLAIDPSIVDKSVHVFHIIICFSVSDTAVIVDDTFSVVDPSKLENFKLVAVPFVDWDNVRIIESRPEFLTKIKLLAETLRDNSSSEVGSEEVRERRSRVSQELTRHGLEVVADGDNLVIAGTVIIKPPYTHQTCDAPNEIILARIRNILKSIT